jgi:hypothetical protein
MLRFALLLTDDGTANYYFSAARRLQVDYPELKVSHIRGHRSDIVHELQNKAHSWRYLSIRLQIKVPVYSSQSDDI